MPVSVGLLLLLAVGVLPGSGWADPEPPARSTTIAPEPDAVDPEDTADATDESLADPTDLRAQVEALTAEVEALREQVAGLAAQVASTRPALHTYRLPDTITFAGAPIPLDRWDVTERLEREFYLVLGDPAQAILWLKRSARYFPYIEGELRAADLPDDLKYVAVVESALRPRAYSWAHASGIWQFVSDTARRYGLRVTPAWDERRDPARSTAAALAYLKDLYRQFGEWPLALAGYNAGAGRVTQAMKSQGVATYYQLALPLETERYFFRILAAKLILEEPGQYGFEVPPEDRYSPPTTEIANVHVVGYLRVQELATAAGSFYREMKALNPAIMDSTLPAGRYDVRVPEGGSARLAAQRAALEQTMAARVVRHVRYRVKRGDTLTNIAARFKVPVSELMAKNRAARKPYLYPGDILVIEVGEAHRAP